MYLIEIIFMLMHFYITEFYIKMRNNRKLHMMYLESTTAKPFYTIHTFFSTSLTAFILFIHTHPTPTYLHNQYNQSAKPQTI